MNEKLETARVDSVDDDDDLDDDERARLDAAIARSLEDIKAGRVRDAREVIAELRAAVPTVT